MRIGFITLMNVFPWGGSEELWALAAARAAEAGHAVAAAVYRWPQRDPHIQQLHDAGVQIVERRLFKGGRIDELLSEVVDPLRKLWAFRPEVLCISQPGSFDIGTGGEATRIRQYLRQSDIPCVLICQSIDAGHVPFEPVRRHAREMYGRASRVCFVGENMVGIAQRHLAADIPNASVVRNPIGLADTRPISWPEGEELMLASVARLEPRKGLDLVLEVLREPQWKHRPWRLRIYGDGPQRDYLPELCGYYGLSDRVQFCGHRSDVRSIWTANHLFVLPSHYEGTSLAMVEAMICGRVPVVTDVGGASEWITDGFNGFLAGAPTVQLLSAAMERAWASRSDWPTLGARARETALTLVDPDPGKTLLHAVESA